MKFTHIYIIIRNHADSRISLGRRTKIKRILLLVIAVIVFSGISSAEQFKIGYLNNTVKKLEAIDHSSGKSRWKTLATLTKTVRNGSYTVQYSENGAGTYGNDGSYKYWSSKSSYKLVNNTLIPVGGKLIFKDKNGNVTGTLQKTFDLSGKTVTCIKDGNISKFDYTNDLLDKDILPAAIENYPFDEKRDFEFHLLTNDPSVYKMTLHYLGVETVPVGNNSYACYKLQMIPDLGAASIFGAFVPKTYFWCTTSSPHKVMKYEGLESGLNTPYLDIMTVE